MKDPADMIEVAGLVKRFGDVTAVESATFSVRRGELFGFLGPNGAGKTTTINMLTGLARPDGGTIRVGGIDCTHRPQAAQHLLGVVPDESNLYPELSGFENLCFCGALYGLCKQVREPRARDLLERFGLAGAADRKFGGYSKGMKRKLTIAAGIVHDPPILFLDEPTTGIDVASSRQIRQLIADLNVSGTTIFLTTHYIEEAERLCRRIAFIVSGRIVRTDTVDSLLQPERERHVLLISVSPCPAGLAGQLAMAFPQHRFRGDFDGQLRVESSTPIHVAALVRYLDDRSLDVAEARLVRPSLEEVFVRITGIEADELRKDRERSGGAT